MEVIMLHDSQDLSYRKPFGAVKCGQEVELRLKIICECLIKRVKLIVVEESINGKSRKNVIEMTHNHSLSEINQSGNNYGSFFETRITVAGPGLLWYYFEAEINDNTYFYGNNRNGYGGIGEITNSLQRSYQITIYNESALPPSWLKNTIMYQIFVDRFYNGNDDGRVVNLKKGSLIHSHWDNDPIYIKDEDGRIIYWDFHGGNLLGVIRKLDYLRELGIDIIYLNPIFEAPSNHKYDTGDYHKIDPMFGDIEVFKKLCNEAKERGIAIILDGVFSHTGSDSIYFNREGSYSSLGAYQSKESQYYSWYRFTKYPEEYECWWGIDVLPNVNELDSSYIDFVINNDNSVINYWNNQGIKGWRLDVADELPDQFIKKLRQKIKQLDSEAILIGEVWEDASNKISYGVRRGYLVDDELDSISNYPFKETLIDFVLGQRTAKNVNEKLMSMYENYSKEHFYSAMNLLGSHDTPRILSILRNYVPNQLDSYEIAVKRLKLLALWQMTFPGAPIIYYGDEVGSEGIKEPLNRRTYPWGKENKELLAWYKLITSLRKRYPVFQVGDWVSVLNDTSPDIYGYIRFIRDGVDLFGQKNDDNLAIILFNRSLFHEQLITLDLHKWIRGSELINVFNGDKLMLTERFADFILQPLECLVLMEQM